MTKKERAGGILKSAQETGTLPGGVTNYCLMNAIIDALPDEPPPNPFNPKNEVGPDAKAAGTPCETSSYSGHCAKDIAMTHKLEWVGPMDDPGNMRSRCKNCGKEFATVAAVVLQHPDGSTALDKCPAAGASAETSPLTPLDKAIEWAERRHTHLCEYRRHIGGKGSRGEEEEFEALYEILWALHRHEALGQRSDPPATSGATQSPQSCCDKHSEEDARKLRIMEAMEKILAWDCTSKFKYACGKWWWITAASESEWREINEDVQWVQPAPEPLWEGEAWVRDKDKAITDIGPSEAACCDYRGPWRKIKVREVR